MPRKPFVGVGVRVVDGEGVLDELTLPDADAGDAALGVTGRLPLPLPLLLLLVVLFRGLFFPLTTRPSPSLLLPPFRDDAAANSCIILFLSRNVIASVCRGESEDAPLEVLAAGIAEVAAAPETFFLSP